MIYNTARDCSRAPTGGVVVEKRDWRTHQTEEDSVVQIDGCVDAHGEEGGRPNDHRHELADNQRTVDDRVPVFVHLAVLAVLGVCPRWCQEARVSRS